MPVSAAISALLPTAGRTLHRHGCAAGQGRRAPVPEGVAAARGLGVHVPHVHETRCGARACCCSRTSAPRSISTRLEAGDDPERALRDALEALARIQVQAQAAAARAAALRPRGAAARAGADAGVVLRAPSRQLELTPDERRLIARRVRVPDRARRSRSRTCSCIATITRATSWSRRQRNPGVIDFQDALRGPVGYDLVSLLKDCYIAWPRERVVRWVQRLSRALLEARRRRPARSDARVPALVRPHRRAAAHQGARHLRAPVVSRRQARLSRRPAAHARLRARHLRALPGAADFRGFVEQRVVPGLPRANARCAGGSVAGAA